MFEQHQGRPPIGVLIVDGHAVIRRGLASYLQPFPAIRVLGEAGDGAAAVRLCAALAPEVVLIDLDLPLADWTRAVRAIREAAPATRLIALTGSHNDELAYRAIEAGVIAYLLKDCGGDTLAEAIAAACQGRPTLAPEATETLVRSVGRPPPGIGLTEREREVLALMVRGLSNPAIAQELHISPSTVKFHVSGILAKLGTSSRTATVVVAMQRHLVE
jgi:DNA-binding NarL/FixJ family response regulator